MSAQLNDPLYFGGLVNANIKANINTPLDLVGASDGFPLFSPPVLQQVFYNLGTVRLTVDLPGNYPPRDGAVVFQWRATGTQQYTPFTSNTFTNPSAGVTAWVGQTTTGIQENTAYEIIATSGIFISPVLRMATGQPATGNPTAAPTVPVAATTPTDTEIIVYFNGGFVGGNPATNVFSATYGPAPGSTLPAPAPVNAFGSLWTITIPGLTASTAYYVKSAVTGPNGVTLRSESSAAITTSASGGAPPSTPPNVPTFVSANSSSITVTFSGALISGIPPSSFGVYVGTTVTPNVNGVFIASTSVGVGVETATATGLIPGVNYYFMSVSENGVAPNAVSPVSAPFQTLPPGPTSPLITNAVTTFLIQGPRFNTPSTTALDYYLNVDAVGCIYTVGTNTATQGQQLFGSMYAGSAVANGATSYAGLCIADQPYNELFGPTSDAYLTAVKAGGDTRLLISLGGFYADILGLFGPYQPAGPAGWGNPTAVNVITSFLKNYCGIGSINPLNWSRKGYGTYFDGLILDFENVGLGGNPRVGNQYPLPQSPAPAFPASATDPKYAPYIQALADVVNTYTTIAPELFFGNAPVSLSICSAETLAAPNNGNICAANSALNTWFPFASASTVPSSATYNATASLALNHPTQMSKFTDVFVQFYNENAVNYLGGANFANLLAQWGYLAILAQRIAVVAGTIKKPRINIGLASGNIIPGFNSAGNAIVPSAQGPTPQLDGEIGPPFTYWYPQYGAGSPPNQTNPAAAQSWPNTGPTLDAVNLASAINQANSLLQTAFANPTLVPSDWCSGTGFWAGGNATTMAKAVYSGKTASAFSPGAILPAVETYVWSDASYPAPDPGWVSKTGFPILPIPNNL
jgi:hypothetical protein